MLALILSMFILLSLSLIYLASAKNHLAEAALHNIQENIRVSSQILQSELRMAGNVGCAKLQNNFPVTTSQPYNMTYDNRLHDYQGNEVKVGTDALTVRYANPLPAFLIETMHDLNNIHIAASPKMAVGDMVVISDCETAEMFDIQALSTASDGTQFIETNKNLTKQYKENSEVSEFEMNTFYIGKTDRKSATGVAIYALYMEDRNFHKTELVEGVDAMQIRYTVFEQGNMREKSSDEVENWAQVVGVSLQLDFDSLNFFPLKKTAYTYVALREK